MHEIDFGMGPQAALVEKGNNQIIKSLQKAWLHICQLLKLKLQNKDFNWTKSEDLTWHSKGLDQNCRCGKTKARSPKALPPNQRLYKRIVHYNKLDYSSGFPLYIFLLALKVCTSWLQKIHAISKCLWTRKQMFNLSYLISLTTEPNGIK